MIKAKTDYSDVSDESLDVLGNPVYLALSANAATFPNPVPDMVTFQTDVNTYKSALESARTAPSKAHTQAKNAARAVLEDDLGSLGAYVNIIAKGDGAIVALSALPSYDTKTTPPPALRDAPTDLRLKQGKASGSVEVRFHQQVSKDNAEVQTCTADPNVEANWSHAAIFTGGRGVLTGLTPGALVWVRVRSIGPGGTLSPWSTVENLRVI